MNKEKFRLSNIPILLIAIVVIGAGLVYFAQSSGVSGAWFGFEKNIEVRKSADEESVAGCMQSCEDMLAGWLEMNPDSKNYTRQGEKIQAKAEQCLAMNTLAGFPFHADEILLSCGLEPAECQEIPSDISIDLGACTDTSWIDETGLLQCCTEDKPRKDCGDDTEWVVGFATSPGCYILDS